jgi:hypothetical protein
MNKKLTRQKEEITRRRAKFLADKKKQGIMGF